MRNILLFYVTLLFISACSHPKEKTTESVSDSSLCVKYATNFSVEYFDNYKKVTVKNHWDNNHSAHYYLVKSDTVSTPNDGLRIKIPITNIVITSSTQLTPIQLLKQENSISGVCSPNSFFDSSIRNRWKCGNIANVGEAFSVNVETVKILNPDVVFYNAMKSKDQNFIALENNSIPLILISEWVENSPLARTEWIKFYATFFDKETIADSIFSATESRYLSLKKLLEKTKQRPTVMCGSIFKDIWYMPGGKGFMTKLFADAGANYFYEKNEDTESIPLTFENVLNSFSNADVWINSPAESTNEILNIDERYVLFKAFKTKNMYTFSNRISENGGNDFWESGVSFPDLLLADLIKAFHPEILPNHKFVYLKKVTQ